MKTALNQLRKKVEKLREESADNILKFRMKDGSLATIAKAELSNPYSLFASWIFNNADNGYRSSDGAKLHCLIQMVNNTSDAPFVPWEVFKDRCPVLEDEFAVVK